MTTSLSLRRGASIRLVQFILAMTVASTAVAFSVIGGRTTMSMSAVGHQRPCERRVAIRTAAAAVASSAALAISSLPNRPSFAAYIDPAVDPLKITKRVYLDVKIGERKEGGDMTGRIVIGLYGEQMPKTSENFETLCERNAYAGTTFYRVLSDFQISGGAIDDPTGNSGKSAFGNYGAPFEPDNYNVKHTKAGLVSMVKDTKGGGVDSRFFIACKDDSGWADDRYAAFGIVVEGMDVVAKIEKVDVARPKNMPKVPVTIIASGVLPEADPIVSSDAS